MIGNHARSKKFATFLFWSHRECGNFYFFIYFPDQNRSFKRPKSSNFKFLTLIKTKAKGFFHTMIKFKIFSRNFKKSIDK